MAPLKVGDKLPEGVKFTYVFLALPIRAPSPTTAACDQLEQAQDYGKED